MTSLVWEDIFNTGVETMDVQHRKIFDCMDAIYHALADNQQKCDPLDGMLDQLELLCQMHFLNEQQLMDDTNYPSASEHKHIHDLFLASIDQFKIVSSECHTTNLLDAFLKLKEDFITHMLNESTTLGAFIKAGPIEDAAVTAL
ncbi:MAG TPA: hemerythrin domain-containing protein [Dongiaceae bacterium]|nr:hemerythrin domain-containing protein [Dongiaceae bacterium]